MKKIAVTFAATVTVVAFAAVMISAKDNNKPCENSRGFKYETQMLASQNEKTTHHSEQKQTHYNNSHEYYSHSKGGNHDSR